jgi:cell division protein FtsA
MFRSPNIIVGLEIGTSKVCAVAGELTENGALNILGLGQARSRGVRKGEIVDAALTCEDIRNAVVEAEEMANVEIRSVYLGISGGHIRGFNNRGFHPVVSHDRLIMEEDVQDVIKNAKAINLSAENRVVHVIRQHFLVNGQQGITNPVGMVGANIQVDVHVVHGNCNRLQNPIRAVQSLSIEVEDVVFSGLASALALLANHQKEQGALVIDLGGGTTEYVVYDRGIVRHTAVLAVGGDHISNDLAYGLKVPLGRAEQLKIEHGSAFVTPSARGKTIQLTNINGLPERSVNLEHLQRIMSLRLEEIFQIIREELQPLGLLDHVRGGLFLCGGGARISGIQELAQSVFELPAALGKTHCLNGFCSALDMPEFATGIGLVKFGSFEQQKRASSRASLAAGFRNTLTQLFRRV